MREAGSCGTSCDARTVPPASAASDGTGYRYAGTARSIRGMSGTEERRVVTSLFIDVVGSTELTVRLGPERIKGALDAAFAELRAIIAAEGGTVEKYIGDAIYALFGAPITHPDDPERALRAAAGARAWA